MVAGGSSRAALVLRTAASAYFFVALSALPVVGVVYIARSLTAGDPDYWQKQWEAFLEKVGYNQRFLFGVMPSITSNLFYWAVSGFYLTLDLTGWLSRYKVQPGKNQPPSSPKLSRAIWVVLMNQVLVGAPLGVLFFELAKWSNKGELDPELIRKVPPLSTFALHILFHNLVREILFFYSHWLLHQRWMYKYVHKMHHEWTAPIALVAVYCHPLEHLLSNIIPVGLGPALLKSHPLINYVWLCSVVFRTLGSHSGYHLPFGPCSEFHDYHHKASHQNYGVLGIFDALHGTDKEWRNTQSCKQHIYLLGFSSSREVVGSREKKQD